MVSASFRTAWVLALFSLACAAGRTETLWVESADAAGFPELSLLASPLNRKTLRLLKDKKLFVKVDSQAATLLAVDPVDTPIRLSVLLDRSRPTADYQATLDSLIAGFLRALPDTAEVHAWALGNDAQPLHGGDRGTAGLAKAWAQTRPTGDYAALRRGLEATLDSMAQAPTARHVLVVLSVTSDPSLAPGQATRRELLAKADARGLHPAVFSYGSDVDRGFLRELGEARGGTTLHSWNPRNLKTAMRRLAVGLGLTRRIRVQSPFFGQDGALRQLKVFGPSSSLLSESRIRYPGSRAKLAPPIPPPVPTTPISPPPQARPKQSTPASRQSPGPEKPPRLDLGPWPLEGRTPSEREFAGMLAARFGVIQAHADGALHRSVRGLELAVENRDPELAKRLYRQARLSLAFLGSTYGQTTTKLEEAIESYATGPAPRAEFLAAQRRQLAGIRRTWEAFKQAFHGWRDNLARIARR